MTNESDSAAVQAADAHGAKRVERITLESGVVLRLKPVSPITLRDAAAHLVRPAVPVVEIPDTGGRTEPNPNDPEYIEALNKWTADVSEAGFTVALILGTEVESLPDGMPSWESDDWIEGLRAAREIVPGAPPLNVRTTGKGRYLDWLRMYAISTNTDAFRLSRLLTTGVTLTEEEVQSAADSFRGVFAWSASVVSSPAPAAAVGDSDPPAGPGTGE